jgi:glycosyltransferase involved in cell wall biosynthesis
MKPKRNTLVLITPGFAASEADSGCLPLQQALVRAWQHSAYCEVVVLALHYPYNGEAYTLFGADVRPLNGRNRGGLQGWRRRRGAAAILGELHRSRSIIGMISCWYGEAAAIGSRFARSHGLPHFCWILGQDAREANHWPRRLRLPGSELVALSPFLQSEFARCHGIRPARVLLPGIEEPVLPEAPGERPLMILGVGSLIPLKRWTVFLQVVAALRKEFPSLQAVLAGSGPEAESLRETAAAMGLAACVRFAGQLPHAGVLHLMRAARLLLHPSEFEGYSGVCQEAIAVGTPVVSACAPGDKLPAGWQLAANPSEMIRAARAALLQTQGICPTSFPIAQTAQQWLDLFEMGLFAQPDAIIDRNAPAIASNEK